MDPAFVAIDVDAMTDGADCGCDNCCTPRPPVLIVEAV